ncbi:MAG: hydrogenase nickel incorporation protein HypB [Proteobacteria bacterium]|nr:hydrogenase nickel incorporation protein HypB [Pseudomonadota bacterium]MCL2307922.1 hydrogenase nickel incorporation protein HypB [Pseudomonadota bacterium]
MCSTCGCGHGEVRIDGVPVSEGQGDPHWHQHEDGTWHSHAHVHEHTHTHTHGGEAHSHAHPHAHDHPHEHGHGHAHGHAHSHGDHEHPHSQTHSHDHTHPHAPLGAVHAPDVSAARVIEIERDLLERNDAVARQNRQQFADRGLFALNLVSSPGSGKTTLLVRTIEALRKEVSCAVIEGDQQTENDADRIRATGAPAVQINTGKGCHLDARMVAQALPKLPKLEDALLFIENVGNLVCPAAFDLGEAHKVAILSVTEGADKPLKYPDMFRAADVLLINKMDLLPHVDFDVEQAVAYARRIQPTLTVMKVSATTGEGMNDWLAWLKRGVEAARHARLNDVQALRQKVAALEAQLQAR